MGYGCHVRNWNTALELHQECGWLEYIDTITMLGQDLKEMNDLVQMKKNWNDVLAHLVL